MPYTYNATITKVIDGDTMVAVLDLGFDMTITRKLRILSLDTPETWRPQNEAEREHGKAATARAKELLENQRVVIHTQKDKNGYYGRLLASIEIAGGLDYAALMKAEGFQKRKEY